MMKSSMKLGEDVKGQRSKRHLDKISNLPDELLALILSFLSTWNAVRTSILSRRWRYLFTLTNCLSFDDAPFIKYQGGGIKEIEPARKERFKEFVYEVLKVHKMSPIRKFSLVSLAIYDKSHLNTWVKHAIQRGVQKVRYQVNNENGLCGLSDDLVMCKTLVNLEVRGNPNHAMKIPLSSWLPSLKILHLHRIRFVDYHSMERLLSSCEFLEELTLKCCAFWARGHVTISLGQLKVLKIIRCYVSNGLFEMEAPKLAYLTYYSICGVKIVPLWKYSRSLVKADLHFNSKANDRSIYGDLSLKNNCDILRTAADKITELHLLSDSVQCLLMTGDIGQVPNFHSLSRLHFSYFSYDSWKYVTSVLDKSPQLETVVFEEGLHRCCRFSAPPPNETLVPFSCHVKVIEVRYFSGPEGLLLLLGHLLINARVLKKFIVHKCYGFDDMENALQISKDLLMLPKASSDCCIELIDFPF